MVDAAFDGAQRLVQFIGDFLVAVSSVVLPERQAILLVKFVEQIHQFLTGQVGHGRVAGHATIVVQDVAACWLALGGSAAAHAIVIDEDVFHHCHDPSLEVGTDAKFFFVAQCSQGCFLEEVLCLGGVIGQAVGKRLQSSADAIEVGCEFCRTHNDSPLLWLLCIGLYTAIIDVITTMS